jgi:hypothetical protein
MVLDLAERWLSEGFVNLDAALQAPMTLILRRKTRPDGE